MDNRPLLAGAAVLAAALLGASAAGLVAPAGAERPSLPSSPPSPEPWIEASHLPPLLRTAGETAELRFDVYCGPADEAQVDAGCPAAGSVFVRPGAAGPFRELPLVREQSAFPGRLAARISDELARSPRGFEYYAVLRSEASGRSLTLPGGGAAAPHRSLLLADPATVALGRHVFGRVRRPDATPARASWGRGPGQVGLEQGRVPTPIGGSSFDVDASGTVYLLDEANRRVLRWRPGAASPDEVPLDVNGTIADLAVAPDGSLHVLETTAAHGRPPVLRSFAPDGAPRGAVALAERPAALLRGPEGPVVLQHPSGQWLAAGRGGRLLPPGEQRRAGSSGRPHGRAGEVVVLRQANELRLAVVGPVGDLWSSWRVTSDTPLGEVQLAEPLGDRLLVVVRVYTEEQAEFAVLLLGDRGLAKGFSVAASEWAETAPLARFRLAAGALYRLGSTPDGVVVDRFDLEAR
ncbi:MAG TPA: hypothetical protein VNJ46_04360 [Gaiellaceae bacterium]|nr:hypothetical protein [Gaiellaceae bacterium]